VVSQFLKELYNIIAVCSHVFIRISKPGCWIAIADRFAVSAVESAIALRQILHPLPNVLVSVISVFFIGLCIKLV